MPTILKKHFTVINLVILSAGIFFITRIISFNISKVLEPPAYIKDIKDMADTEKKRSMPIDAYNSILERNIFNSKRLTEGTPLPTPGVLKSLKEERSSIPIKLIGTVAGNASYALAIIEDPYQKGEKIFRLNDTIAPGITLAEINRKMIVVTRDGVREEIEIVSEEWYRKIGRQIKESVAELFSPESAPVSSASPERNNSGTVKVAQVNANNKANNKDNSIPLSEGMNSLLTQAKLVQQISGGESDGFMIHSIEPDSLYDKIGLKDGDIIAVINGLDLKDPEEALEIYQTLKNEDLFVIEFTRNGHKMTLTTLNSDVLALLIYLSKTGS